VADYDGDGRFDLVIRRPRDNSWYYLSSLTNQMVGTQWGWATDTTVPGDYDADGKTDVAVCRGSSGYWYIRQSKYGFGMRSEHWGAAGDIPIAAPFKR
jgi:hypothetical protein